MRRGLDRRGEEDGRRWEMRRTGQERGGDGRRGRDRRGEEDGRGDERTGGDGEKRTGGKRGW